MFTRVECASYYKTGSHVLDASIMTVRVLRDSRHSGVVGGIQCTWHQCHDCQGVCVMTWQSRKYIDTFGRTLQYVDLARYLKYGPLEIWHIRI